MDEMNIIRVTATGDVWICPICGRKYHLLHRERIDPETGGIKVLKHDFEEVVE